MVKLITPGANADFQVSLLQRAAKLNHPNLLPLLPGGRSKLADTDLVFTFMEYVEEDFGRSLPDRPLSEKKHAKCLGRCSTRLAISTAKGLPTPTSSPPTSWPSAIKSNSQLIQFFLSANPGERPLDAYGAAMRLQT